MVSLLLLATLVGTAFAESSSSPTSSLTPQIVSVDIDALRLVPGIGQAGTAGQELGVVITNIGANFTAGFSFAPAKGFIQVNSVLLTVIYAFAGGSFTNVALSIELNGHSPILISTIIPNGVQGSSPFSGTAPLPVQSIKQGSDSINVGLAAPGATTSVYSLYEVRLTVEYTYLG